MRLVALLVLVFLPFILCESVETLPQHVVALTDESFSTVQQGEWLVKFYAPWCGHCQHLAPIWEEAAIELDDVIRVAKVDCTVHSASCTQYGVNGYPTLKYFKNGISRDYRGSRTRKAITAYARRMTGPLVQPLSDAKDAFFAQPGTKLVYVTTGDDANEAVFLAVAKKFIEVAAFGQTTDPAVVAYHASEVKVARGSVYAIKEDDVEVYRGAWDVDALAAWVDVHRYALLPEFTPDISAEYTQSPTHTVMILVEPLRKKTTKAYLQRLRAIAKDNVERFHFAWVDGPQWEQFLEQFEITVGDLPFTFVWDAKDGFHYLNKSVKSDAQIRQLLDDVANKRIPAQGEGKGTLADMRKAFKMGIGKAWNVINAYPVYFVVALGVAIGLCLACCIFATWDFSDEEAKEAAAKEGGSGADGSSDKPVIAGDKAAAPAATATAAGAAAAAAAAAADAAAVGGKGKGSGKPKEAKKQQ